MATGTIKWFAQALLDLGTKKHDLGADTIKVGIVTSTTVPGIGTSDPRWGAGGGTDFSANQVATTGTTYTGPKTLTTKSWTNVSNVPTLRADDITLPIDASGFTNAAYAIIYNDTDAGKRALGWIELSAAGTVSIQAGQVVINFGGAGTDILTLTQS